NCCRGKQGGYWWKECGRGEEWKEGDRRFRRAVGSNSEINCHRLGEDGDSNKRGEAYEVGPSEIDDLVPRQNGCEGECRDRGQGNVDVRRAVHPFGPDGQLHAAGPLWLKTSTRAANRPRRLPLATPMQGCDRMTRNRSVNPTWATKR